MHAEPSTANDLDIAGAEERQIDLVHANVEAMNKVADRLEGLVERDRELNDELRRVVEAVPVVLRPLTRIEADAIHPQVHELRLLNARTSEVLADLTRLSTLIDQRCADTGTGVHLSVSLDEGGTHFIKQNPPAAEGGT